MLKTEICSIFYDCDEVTDKMPTKKLSSLLCFIQSNVIREIYLTEFFLAKSPRSTDC